MTEPDVFSLPASLQPSLRVLPSEAPVLTDGVTVSQWQRFEAGESQLALGCFATTLSGYHELLEPFVHERVEPFALRWLEGAPLRELQRPEPSRARERWLHATLDDARQVHVRLAFAFQGHQLQACFASCAEPADRERGCVDWLTETRFTTATDPPPPPSLPQRLVVTGLEHPSLVGALVLGLGVLFAASMLFWGRRRRLPC